MDTSVLSVFSNLRAAEASMEMTRELVSLQTFQTLTSMVANGIFSDMDAAISAYGTFKGRKK